MNNMFTDFFMFKMHIEYCMNKSAKTHFFLFEIYIRCKWRQIHNRYNKKSIAQKVYSKDCRRGNDLAFEVID